MPKYKVNGKTYNIPDDKVAGFEHKYPDATVEYRNEGKTYQIPLSKREGFLKKYPNASLGTATQEVEKVEQPEQPATPIAESTETQAVETKPTALELAVAPTQSRFEDRPVSSAETPPTPTLQGVMARTKAMERADLTSGLSKPLKVGSAGDFSPKQPQVRLENEAERRIEGYVNNPLQGQLRKAENELAELEARARKRIEDVAAEKRKPKSWTERLTDAFTSAERAVADDAASESAVMSALEADDEYRMLQLAIREKSEAVENMREEVDARRGKDVGFWRGFGRHISDPYTWSGTLEMQDALTRMRIADKMERGLGLTQTEQQALEAQALREETESLFGGNRNWRYTGGVAGAYLPVFGLDFARTGGGFGAVSALGKVAGKGATKMAVKFGAQEMAKAGCTGLKSYVKTLGVKGVGKYMTQHAAPWLVKATGETADALLLRSPMMVATIQADDAVANVVNEKLGGVTDQAGVYRFENDKTWGEAVTEALGDMVIENASEMSGVHIDAVLGKMFGGVHGVLSKVKGKGYADVYNGVRKGFEKAGISSFFGEVGEEYTGQLWRTMASLESAQSVKLDENGNPVYDENGNPVMENNLLSGKWHKDLWGGMALTMLLPGVGKATMTGAVGAMEYTRLKHRVNRADARAGALLGEQWDGMRAIFDMTTNENIGDVAEVVMTDETLSAQEREAVMDYLEVSMNMRGWNLGNMAQSQPSAQDEAQVSETQEESQAEMREAFMDGYDATEEATEAQAKEAMEAAQRVVAEMLPQEAVEDIAADPVGAVAKLGDDPDVNAAVLEYLNARMRYEGIMQRKRDDSEVEIERSNAMVDARTNRTTGVIQPATMKQGDRSVYVVAGNLVQYEDGSGIDNNASDGSIIIRDAETGTLEQVSPESILNIDVPLDPVVEKERSRAAIEEKLLSLQAEDESHGISERISQEDDGSQNERVGSPSRKIQDAAVRCQESRRAYEETRRGSGQVRAERPWPEVEARDIEVYAKESGQWLDYGEVMSKGTPGASGNENDTYISEDGQSIYKVNNLMNSKDISSLLEKVALHNKYFPDTAYELEGFTGFGRGSVYPVLKQAFVNDATYATVEEIDNYMSSLGFEQSGEAAYSNGDVTISDLRPRNVLKTTGGNIYVVDAEFSVVQQVDSRRGAMAMPEVGDRIELTDDTGQKVEGLVAELTDDGYVVETGGLVNGRYVSQLSAHELAQRMGINREEAPEIIISPAVDEVAGLNDADEADEPNESNEADEVAGQQLQQPSAFERVPKDEQGNPIYEQADTDTAWDAIVEQTEGDEVMAQTVADGMVADKEAALKKIEKAKAKGGVSIAEKIAAEKERKAAIDAAKQELEKWQAIASVMRRRKQDEIAAQERAAKEEARRKEVEAMERKAEAESAPRNYAKVYDTWGLPVNMREYLLRALSSRGMMLRWKDSEHGSGGLGRHLGLLRSESERRKRMWMLDEKAGMLPEEAAEYALQDFKAQTGMDPHMDEMEVLNEMLDILGSYDSSKAMWEEAKRNHDAMERGLDAELDDYTEEELERMQWYWDNFHMMPEEYEAYIEVLNDTFVPLTEEEYYEFISEIADDEQRRIQGASQSGNQILHGEQALPTGRAGALDARTASIDDRVDSKDGATSARGEGAEVTDRTGSIESDSGQGRTSETYSVSKEKEINLLDPRTMSEEEKQRRGDMLRNAPAIDVKKETITSTSELSARKAAEKWWDENVNEPALYDTEAGEVEINRNSIESSLAHRYGQKKLDAITSLIEGFENAVYLGTMPDSRERGVIDHYFAYPIMYDGELNYVFCRAMQDANKNRLYVHEVFVGEKIKKGDTLQTAASKPHGGISLYRDILANVLQQEGKLQYRFDGGAQTEHRPANVSVTASPEEMQGKKKEVWSASEVQNEQSATDSTLRGEDKSDNPTTPNGNVPSTSEGKDTTNSRITKELGEKVVTKAVNENGKPIVLYNSNAINEDDFGGNLELPIQNWSREIAQSGFWFTPDADFSRKWIEEWMEYDDTRISKVTLDMRNPLVIDAKGQDWKDIDGKSTDKWAQYAEQNGYDGLIIRNVLEGTDSEYTSKVVDDYCVFRPEQIKSADWDGSLTIGEQAEEEESPTLSPTLSQKSEQVSDQDSDAASFLDVVRTLYSKGKEVASKLFSMKFFDVAQTPKFMQELGLRGDKFTIRYGVIARHFGKDSEHTLPQEIWEQLPEALLHPFAITKYYEDEKKQKQKGYRLYTALQLANGSYVVVSAEVKNAGRDIEVNAINTIFGRSSLSDVHDELIYTSETITPDQQSLLNGNNPHQYTAERELSSEITLTDANRTETTQISDLSDVSEGKDSKTSSDTQKAAYTIEPAQYTKKNGNVLDMYLVKFAFELSGAGQRTASSYARAEKGWYDSKRGGFMMRSEEIAKQFAEQVSYNHFNPITFDDLKALVDGDIVHEQVGNETKSEDSSSEGTPKQTEIGAKSESAPKTKSKPQPKNEGQLGLVSDERMADLKERLRKKLGGQMNIGIDPEILAIGLEIAVGHLDRGVKSFTDFAKVMIDDLGDVIRPYLKAFYNGARELPEVADNGLAADMTPYDEVQTFDVANFDKSGIDAIATAETVTREAEVEQEVEVAQAREQYDEYSELMKKELEEKEAKYAEMDATVEAAGNLANAEEDDVLYRSDDNVERAREALKAYAEDFGRVGDVELFERPEDLYDYAISVGESEESAHEFVEFHRTDENITASYDPDTDKILIFAWKECNPYRKLFHENVHRAIAHLGGVERFDALLDEFVYIDESLVKKINRGYVSNQREEVATHVLEAALTGNAISELRDALSEEAQTLLDEILKEVGYDGQRDTESDVSRFEPDIESGSYQRLRGRIRRRLGRRLKLLGGRDESGRQGERAVGALAWTQKGRGQEARGSVEAANIEEDDAHHSTDAIKDKVEALLNQALSGEFKGKPISIGRLTEEGKAYLEKISGVSFRSNVDFVLNPSDLVHIYKDHFGNNEKDKGQNVPLEIEDIRNLVDVISTPDKVIFFKEGEGSNRNMFYFFKEAEDGTYNLMEIYSDRKGNLTAKTFYKTKKDATQRVMDIEKSLLPTSETYFGAILSDAKIPQMFESASVEEDFSARDGEGTYTDDEVSWEQDFYGKVLGKPYRRKAERRAFAERERKRMVERVRELAEKLHLDNVEVITDLESPKGQKGLKGQESQKGGSVLSGKKRRAKGFYSKSRGKITIVIPNHLSVADAVQTLLHEAVAHYGLRQLFGERFDTFLDNVFENADESIRKRIVALAAKNGWDFRTATEEYLASLAEDTQFEEAYRTGWWQQIKAFFLKMLDKIGFEDLASPNHLTLDQTSELDGSRSPDGVNGVTLTDNELRYILWRSYENLAEPGRHRSILGEAADVAMQYELGVGNYSDWSDGADWSNRVAERAPHSIEEVNERFNAELEELTEENAQSVILNLGYPNNLLIRAGVSNKPIRLYGNKVIKKMKKHGFALSDIRNLPNAINNPVAVFNNYKTDSNRAILTELHTSQGNILVTISWGKGTDAELNIVSSVFGKNKDNIVAWINKGYATYINKEKALEYLRISAPIAEAQDNQELISATKVVEKFENPKDEEELLFRDGNPEVHSREMARWRYERRVKSGMFQSQEALQDSMLALKEAMLAIGDEKYIEAIPGYENAYLGENRLSSVNKAEADAFARLVFKPMLDAVAKLARNDAERLELIDYMMAKHGLERNEYMRQQAEENGEDADRDFAGLTALTGMADVAAAEAEAQRMVTDYEDAHDTTALWEKVNAVSKAILQKSYECGMMSKETFDKVSGMYEYYIPLRGFDEKTSAEAYAYLSHKESAFNAPIKKAKGRSSKADDPLANLQSMAEGAIIQGNRNKLVKQRFLNFVLNHPSDLVSVSDLWVRYNEMKDEWEPVFPDNIDTTDTPDEVEQKMLDFETKMEGLAQQYPDRYKHGKDAIGIPYRIVESRDMRQHQIVVKRGGRDYILTINGNPRAAQALNGQTNPDNDMSGAIGAILRAGETINRQLSAFYTTRNPDFIVSNFMRDMLYTNTMAWIKESPNYALRFHRNYVMVNPAKLKQLLAKHRKGTLDMSNKTEAMFHQFMMNGGETGYTNIRDIEQHKNEIRRELKRANGKLKIGRAMSLLAERFDELNRAVENCARFAAFVTSREMGRSIDRSIYDAKEISVNFNKKGSGAKFLNATGQTRAGNASAFVSGIGRSGYVFWNAAIQGTTNFGRQMKRHPAKAFTGMAVMFLLGALTAYLGGDDDDDDDKNAYYNLPEYVRRSNILFRAGDSWISIPLPIEYRAFYGMGELMTSIISGKEHLTGGEIAEAIAGQVTQILPIDILEGGGGWNAFVPSAVKPITEAYVAEKSWTGMPLYKDTPYNKDMPEWTKAYKSANRHIVNLAATLNEATGGDPYTKGGIDFNPAKVEYLLNGYFSGVFSTIDKMTKTAETIAGAREWDPRSVLIVNRLVKAGDERTEYRAVNNEYFRLKEEHDRLKTRLKHYEEDTDNGIFDYAEKIDFLYNSPEYERYEIFEDYRKDIDDLYEELKEVVDDEGRKQIEAELNELKKEMIQEMEYTRKRK